MGTHDHFHKRREKSSRKPSRNKASREVYKRVLIVCEGTKSEPNYLRDLKTNLQLRTVEVDIDGKSDSSPDRIFEYARNRYLEEKNRNESYDRVYCVFDKDSHDSYDDTLRAIQSKKPKNLFFAITSVPCFEYWILLHYEYTTRPYNRTERKSPCDCVMDDLLERFPEYEKGAKDVYSHIEGELDFAIANSKRALNSAQQTGTDNPTTLMHELVEYLRDLK